MKTVAGLFSNEGFLLDPTGAAAADVGALEILPGEGPTFLEQLEHGFRELHAGGPGFVHAGTSEHVGGAGTLADSGEAVTGQVGLATAARLLQGLSAPGAEAPAFHVPPEVRVQQEML